MTSSTTSTTNQGSFSGTCQDTPLSDDALTLYPEFTERIRLRLEIGRASYGDKSFSIPMVRLADEICQELLDVAGWSFIQYARIQRLVQHLKLLDGGQEAVNLSTAADCLCSQAPPSMELDSPRCGKDR